MGQKAFAKASFAWLEKGWCVVVAVYKVPQDVEADDKLIGPFSFRQFIYLIVVAISMAGAWGLSQLFVPLAIVPLPIIVFFAALALPLRKDQPMEAYLSAVVSFYFLKSRKRFWIPDGINSFVTIIPPKDADKILTKELDETEATRRLDYLAQLVDTHGWAIRGAGGTPDTSISTDLYYESRNSQQTPDMMDDNTAQAQEMTKKLDQDADERREEAKSNMMAAAKQLPTPVAAPAANKPTAEAPRPSATAAAAPAQTPDEPPVSKLPSVEEIRARQNSFIKKQQESQSRDAITIANALTEEAMEHRNDPVVKTETKVAPTPAKVAPSTSVSTPDTGTMELTREQANELSTHSDLKVSTIEQQANQLAEKNKALQDGDEVTISFR